jgi:Ca2+-binding RTX toxin-like protein
MNIAQRKIGIRQFALGLFVPLVFVACGETLQPSLVEAREEATQGTETRLVDDLAPNFLCNGLTGTIVDTTGANLLVGTPGNDVMLGLDGNDIIYGMGGNDTICGGTGNDTIWGNNGDDTLFGGLDSDQLNGGNGFDHLYGGLGFDNLDGASGFDVCGSGPAYLNCEAFAP